MKYRKLKSYKFGVVEDYHLHLKRFSFLSMQPLRTSIKHPFFELHSNAADGSNSSELIIKKGYAWDGSSIPYNWLLGIFYDVDKYCKVPSMVHDMAYQAGWLGLLPLEHRDYFDRLYRDMMIARGMSKSQANRRYWAVSNYSEKYFVPKKDERDIVYEVE